MVTSIKEVQLVMVEIRDRLQMRFSKTIMKKLYGILCVMLILTLKKPEEQCLLLIWKLKTKKPKRLLGKQSGLAPVTPVVG